MRRTRQRGNVFPRGRFVLKSACLAAPRPGFDLIRRRSAFRREHTFNFGGRHTPFDHLLLEAKLGFCVPILVLGAPYAHPGRRRDCDDSDQDASHYPRKSSQLSSVLLSEPLGHDAPSLSRSQCVGWIIVIRPGSSNICKYLEFPRPTQELRTRPPCHFTPFSLTCRRSPSKIPATLVLSPEP